MLFNRGAAKEVGGVLTIEINVNPETDTPISTVEVYVMTIRLFAIILETLASVCAVYCCFCRF